MRLIDADQFKAKLLSFMDRKAPTPSDTDCILDGVLNLLEEQPTIYPVKHGHWINIDAKFENMYVAHQCSICKSEFLGDASNFCPRCGAKMDGDDK